VDGTVIAGLHLHGISDARDSGGHVHEFTIENLGTQQVELTVTLDELLAVPVTD
jgi:alpha-acetolactate decarboxylase